jgi:uncharacterized protein YndB with AHSA1/START domain
MASSDGRRTATITAVLDHPIDSVWATLVDPLATMWLMPKAAYAVPVPDPVEGFGELRCCWIDQWRKGVRSRTVLEVVRDEQALRVSFADRSNPESERTTAFQLSPEGTGTRVDIEVAKRRTPLSLSPAPNLEHLVQRLTEVVAGSPVAMTDPQIITWAPGAGQHDQVNQIDITAPPKLIWSLIDKQAGKQTSKDITQLDPGRLASWRSTISGVEYRYDISRLSDGGLTCELARLTRAGKYQLTTVNSLGTQVDYELLPGEQSWNLRTTHRWTIPIKAKHVRDDARQWLAKVKVTAESQAGPPPSELPSS